MCLTNDRQTTMLQSQLEAGCWKCSMDVHNEISASCTGLAGMDAPSTPMRLAGHRVHDTLRFLSAISKACFCMAC